MRVMVVRVGVRDVLPGRGESVGDRAGGQEGHVELLSVEGDPAQVLSAAVVVAADRVDVRPKLVEQGLFLLRRSGRPALRLFHSSTGAAPYGADAADPPEMRMEAACLPMESFLALLRRTFP
jgi:hypothetical protein